MTTRGQAIIEYAVMLGIVTGALVAMATYAKRGLQAAVKVAVDDMSPLRAKGLDDFDGERAQLDGLRSESGDRQTSAIEPGTVLARTSQVVTTRERTASRCETSACADLEYFRTTEETLNQTTGALTERGEGVSSYGEMVVSKP